MTTNTPTPPPGSPEAVAQGCLCAPVVFHLDGEMSWTAPAGGLVTTDSAGYLIFVADTCPLHGTSAQPDAGKGRE